MAVLEKTVGLLVKMGCNYGPIDDIGGLKTGLVAGRTVASLSKEIGNFFDATDAAKKKLQKRCYCSDVNSVALDRWAKEREAAQAEEELREWVTNNLGLSQWQALLRIRKEVLQEKREAEAQARREAMKTRIDNYHSGNYCAACVYVYRE